MLKKVGLFLVCGCILAAGAALLWNEDLKKKKGIPPSAGVYVTHQQYDRMEHRIEDMEAALRKNGLPIPGTRIADLETGPSTR